MEIYRRSIFEAFDLKIAFDKRNGQVEIWAAVTEEVAKALSDSDGLLEEGALVTLRDIAGARSVAREERRILLSQELPDI